MKQQKQVLLILAISLFAFGQYATAQKTETNFNAYTGLFSFRGNGTTSNSMISYDFEYPKRFLSNSFGKRSGFSYGFELQRQRITRDKQIFGIGASFESLTSKVNVDTVTENGFIYYQFPATGNATLHNTFITLNTFYGHRYFVNKITLDILLGFDFAFCLRSVESGNAVANNKNYTVDEHEISKPTIDIRPRLQIKTQYKKIGLIVGYSLGLTNFNNQTNNNAFSNFFRTGLSYQIK